MEDQRFFAILDKDDRVVNIITFPKNPEPIDILGSEGSEGNNNVIIDPSSTPVQIKYTPKPEDLLQSYPEDYKLQEYSQDKSITNNVAIIGYTYYKSLDAFIPPQPDLSYNLNFETFEWEPNPNLEYDLHGDGIMYKWNGSGWIPAES